MPAKDVVAAFDSASVMHGALAAALRGEPLRHLGNPEPAAAVVRAAGRLPWSVVRPLYTRIGAAEGIDPGRLGDVDCAAVADAFADGFPTRRYGGVLVGCSNGALTHLAAAMQLPWLPGTFLLPVARTGDPHRPVEALEFGLAHAPDLLEHNPDIVLHHMHDQVQDELMVARMTYFRIKWRGLPAAYERFLATSLAPGAPVILVEDTSTWPVVRVSERHVFQSGAQGGLSPEAYLERPHTPTPDDEAAEAEWGAEPGLGGALEEWCRTHGHPLVRLLYHGPQTVAAPVADVMRDWVRSRGERADRLLVPSFILGDPWQTISTATVPYWTFFSVRPALDAFASYLDSAEQYNRVDILLFQHGVDSEGIARPQQWLDVAHAHGAQARIVAVDPDRFPHDIASIGRYSDALAELPAARQPWSPLPVDPALRSLAEAGLTG